MADKCYLLGQPRGPLSWMQAGRTCQLSGGRLASVRSPTEMKHLLDFFTYLGWQSVQVYIGLHAASSSLPDM